jgi:hypothetical protein
VLKRIHVNQHVIRRNRRTGASDAPIRVKTYSNNVGAHRVMIAGPSELVYAPDRPLACGARLWVETRVRVVAYDAESGAVTELE